jgi:predicted dehydrogenase
MTRPLRVGLIGAGGNTRARHVPGLRAVAGVELVAVCNRRRESTAAAAAEFGIPRTFDRWEDLVADPEIDAVVVGTWPYLHAAVTAAALAAGKHVLTEARLSRDAAEARQMLQATRDHPDLVAQVVPSPYGMKCGAVVRELLAEGYVGELREAQIVGRSGALADPAAPLSWRQDQMLSGFNMLTLGILHETLLRWLPQPECVLARAYAFIAERIDPASGARRPVGTPDSVQVIATLPDGAASIYQLSGVTPFGQSRSPSTAATASSTTTSTRIASAARAGAPAHPPRGRTSSRRSRSRPKRPAAGRSSPTGCARSAKGRRCS